jgi:signal transduction histidine kinase
MQTHLESEKKIDFEVAQEFSFGLFRVDLSGNVLFANNSFLKLLGFQSFEELQQHLTRLSSDQLKKCFSPNRLNILSHHKTSDANEFTWISNEGEKIVLREYVNAVKNNESLLYLDCVVENVSEKSLLDKIYTDIKSTDNSILRAIPDYIFVVSKHGDILETKNNYHRVFPHFTNLTGRNLNEIFNTDVSSLMLRLIERSLQNGEKETIEFQFNDSKCELYFEARFVIRQSDDVVMILRDITAQKEAELRLENTTEALKQSNATKDKFFSIISHDLRTPLNGILNYAEILSNETDILSKEEIKEFSNYILDISRNTIGLLSNLLEWSRFQSGKIAFQPNIVRICEIVDKVAHLVMPGSSAKNINIQNLILSTMHIYGDENMLSSIFLNLIGNAIKFTDPGGSIIVSAEEMDDTVQLCVTDTGVGMSEETIKKLFISGITFTTIGTAKEKGTGLGLMLCKEFVKIHEGIIWVTSNLGKGTSFYFTLSKNLKFISGEQ